MRRGGRQGGRDRNRLHAGQRRHTVDHIFVKRDALRGARVLAQRNLHRQDVIWIESRANRPEPDETANQQAAANQENHRKRHLRHDENTPRAMPKTIPLNREIPSVNASTRQSMATSLVPGKVLWPNAESTSVPAWPRKMPRTPPASPMHMLSIRSWRMRTGREPPSAVRTANSFLRPSARESSRLATLAQAISNTSPTAAERISTAGRTSAAICCCRSPACAVRSMVAS